MHTSARHSSAFIQVFDSIAAPRCLSPTLTRSGRADKERDPGNVEKTMPTERFQRATVGLLLWVAQHGVHLILEGFFQTGTIYLDHS